MSIHEGHRERLKERFRKYGLENFDDHNVLELLLVYAIPRKDVNPIAHALLDKFGSLETVFEASVEELCAVPGVGEGAATIIRLIPQVSRRYMIAKGAAHDVIRNSTDAGAYLVPRYMYERDEVVYMLCLDAVGQVSCCRELSRGVVDSAEISIRKIVETALNYKASGVILAHNHVSGLAIPSAEDEITTRKVAKALELVGVELSDHIVVAGEDYISMADSGILMRINKS